MSDFQLNLDIVVLLYEVLNLTEAFCLNWLSLTPLWQRKVRALALLLSGGGGSLGPSPSLCWHLRQNWDFSTSGWGCEFQLPTGSLLSPLWRWPHYHQMTWKSRFSSVLFWHHSSEEGVGTALLPGVGGSPVSPLGLCWCGCGWVTVLLLLFFLMRYLPRVEQLPSKIFCLTSFLPY